MGSRLNPGVNPSQQIFLYLNYMVLTNKSAA
jgi:hypothetical protein